MPLGAELREEFANPLKFQWGTGGAEQPPATIDGFDAALLIDLCKAIIAADAEGKLSERYSKIARQAQIIVGAPAKAGIRGLVYALAGYDPGAEEVIAAFKLYVQEEARKYEPEFPNELYMQWHRLYMTFRYQFAASHGSSGISPSGIFITRWRKAAGNSSPF
jgi:hypothetical protein